MCGELEHVTHLVLQLQKYEDEKMGKPSEERVKIHDEKQYPIWQQIQAISAKYISKF